MRQGLRFSRFYRQRMYLGTVQVSIQCKASASTVLIVPLVVECMYRPFNLIHHLRARHAIGGAPFRAKQFHHLLPGDVLLVDRGRPKTNEPLSCLACFIVIKQSTAVPVDGQRSAHYSGATTWACC